VDSGFGNVAIIVSGRQPVVTSKGHAPDEDERTRAKGCEAISVDEWTRFRVRGNVGGESEDCNQWRCMQWRTAITNDR
jgi:hypothetical protein